MKQSNVPYFIFVIGLFFCLISFSFLTEGMFTDGTFYSCISHQLAKGQCSFWHLNDYTLNNFYSHPPLALQMQGWFLSIFGDNIYCDKIYSVLTYIIVGLLMCLIWKKVTEKSDSTWMPLLFWVCTPLVTWGATNNMLENTMSIFITASIYVCLCERRPYVSSFVAGLFVFLAFMVKGPTALFPLVFPMIQYFFQKEKSLAHYLLRTIVMTASTVVCFGLMILISKDAQFFFINYYQQQIEESFNAPAVVAHRFQIVCKWIGEMLVGVAIIGVGFIITYKKQIFYKISNIKTSIRENNALRKDLQTSLKFFLVGLCGVLPIMITMKQRSYYIIPTLPFFAISMALIFKQIFKGNEIKETVKYSISCIVLLTAITLNVINFGKFSRDKETLHDIHAIEHIISHNDIILIPNSLSDEYSLHEYFSRYFDVKLSTQENANKYMLFPKNENPNDYQWFSKYQKVDISTKKYDFFELKIEN